MFLFLFPSNIISICPTLQVLPSLHQHKVSLLPPQAMQIWRHVPSTGVSLHPPGE
ncbi:unnamed protein product [Ixodes pacificus]